MHSIILAAGNAVPFIHAPYAECGRKRQMVRDMGLGEYLIDLDDAQAGEKMLDTALKILRERPALCAKLRETRNKLAALSAKSMAEVTAFLK